MKAVGEETPYRPTIPFKITVLLNKEGHHFGKDANILKVTETLSANLDN